MGQSRQEWAIRKGAAGSPTGVGLRDLTRRDPALVASDVARLRVLYGEQLGLW